MAPNARPSKLIDKLRQVARGPVSPIGFGRTSGTPVPALVLIVSLARNDGTLAEAAIRGGADALIGHLNQDLPEAEMTFGSLDAERDGLQSIASAAGQTPWGIRLGAQGNTPTEDITGAIGLGVDFAAASAAVAPASLLLTKGVGKIISIDRELDLFLIRTIGELQVDAVEVSLLDASKEPEMLTVLDVMKYRKIADTISQSVIVNTQGRIKPEDVPALREAGVHGLLLEVGTAGTDLQAIEENTRAFRQAIDKAGGPLARGRSIGVILPQITPAQSVQEMEPELPEEPEEW